MSTRQNQSICSGWPALAGLFFVVSKWELESDPGSDASKFAINGSSHGHVRVVTPHEEEPHEGLGQAWEHTRRRDW